MSYHRINYVLTIIVMIGKLEKRGGIKIHFTTHFNNKIPNKCFENLHKPLSKPKHSKIVKKTKIN